VQSISCPPRLPARVQCASGALAILLSFDVAAQDVEPRVPYVPTPQEVVERMLRMAKVGPGDYLIDLGSGDGRIVITAAKRYGARGFGVDINPERIDEANVNARKAGVTDKVAFYQRDLFKTDLSKATVITMYLLPRVNVELRPKLLALAPGTRIVSHDFDMGDWKADAHAVVDAKEKYGGEGGRSDVYFWAVPARVAGVWRWQLPVGGKPRQYELKLDQQYQRISGGAWIAGRQSKIAGARLRGADIRFQFTATIDGVPVRHAFAGKVDGDVIAGTATVSGSRIQGRLEWTARRPAKAAAAAPVPAPRPLRAFN